MKKLLLIICVLGLTLTNANAQVAKWLIKPEYDQIELVNGNLFKGYASGKTYIWDQNGQETARIDSDVQIIEFQEGIGVILEKNSQYIVGILDEYGKFINLKESKYSVTHNYPYYSSGYLLVRQGTKYVFLDKSGTTNFGYFENAYPFFEDVACVAMAKKEDEIVWNYLFHQDASYLFDAKNVPSFCASFHDGIAVVAFDKKFYIVDKSKTITPMHTDKNLKNKKSQVVSNSKEQLVNKTATGYVIEAQNAKFEFDKMMRPTLLKLDDQPNVTYSYSTPIKPFVDSDFEKYSSHNGKYGLSYKEELLLPPQFDFIPQLVDDNAVVKINKKYGIVTLDKDANISFKVNNNEYISFVHQYHTTKMMVSLPSFIKCSSAVVLSKSEFCEIQTETRVERENIEANVIGYDCRLTIDKNLTDTLTIRDYYFSIKYEGLQSIDYRVGVEEWFVKYYKVELTNKEFAIQAGDSIQVEFDVLKSDSRMDDPVYFKKVELISKNLRCTPQLNKISESHYNFYLSESGVE